MEDKTPMYMLIIVGIVALVGVVYMLTGTGHSTSAATSSGNTITGNAINEDIEPTSFKGFGRFILGVVLLGACVYMYRNGHKI
jgi:hypothetical protein